MCAQYKTKQFNMALDLYKYEETKKKHHLNKFEGPVYRFDWTMRAIFHLQTHGHFEMFAGMHMYKKNIK